MLLSLCELIYSSTPSQLVLLLNSSLIDLCGEGLTYYEQRCFHYGSFKGPYSTVQTYCKNLGASLPRLDDEAKSYFAERMIAQGSAWIGLTDGSQEGTWKWEDGSTAVYTDWLSGQPNGGVTENCAVIQGGGWADVACSSTYNVMCEKGKIFILLISTSLVKISSR